MSDRSDPSGNEPTVGLESLPDPAVRYAVREGEPVVDRVGEAFVARFGAVDPGTPVEECCERCGLEPTELSTAELCAALAAEDRLSTEVVHLEGHGPGSDSETEARPAAGQQAYQLRATASASGRPYDGCLTLTPQPLGAGGAVEADRLASVISHDLRNPLDVAEARLQAARETGDPEHFEHLARAHARIERIIRDVLTLARGDGAISPSGGVAVASVAADAWDTVDTGTAEFELEDGLPAAEADADRLQRLFENLFRNSVEHGGAATTRVWVGPAGEDGFFVADDGPGVVPEERSRVFLPGYSSREGGTGLGLTIVRQIAQAHDWTVSLTASTAGGARFEFHGLERNG